MKGGRLHYCKECVKRRVTAHRTTNADHFRQYERNRYRSNPARREQLASAARAYLADPVRKRASKLTSNAIRNGKLQRPKRCEACGSTCTPEAHHWDYNRPLDVQWLCRSCHVRVHKGTLCPF